MRKRLHLRDDFSDKAMDFAHRLGDGLRQAPDGAGRWLHDVSGGAGQWLRAGMALGAARTGARAAGTVARRHPVALAAAAIGIGAAVYAVARHRRKKAEQEAFGRRSQRMREAMERDTMQADASQATDAEPLAGDIGVGPDR